MQLCRVISKDGKFPCCRKPGHLQTNNAWVFVCKRWFSVLSVGIAATYPVDLIGS